MNPTPEFADQPFRPRLFDPDATDDPDTPPPAPSSASTLPQYYRRVIAPDAASLSIATQGEHRQALHRWQQFCDSPTGAKKDRTAHPVLSAIDTDMIRRFSVWLTETPHSDKLGNVRTASPRSANKSVQYVRGWLRQASEEDLTNHPGRVRKHREEPGDHRISIPSDHVDAIMQACRVAEWPTRWLVKRPDGTRLRPEVDPALFWRFSIVWLYIFGQRRGDVLGVKRENKPHRWGNFLPQRENPRSYAISPGGWLIFEQAKTRKRLDLPINSVSRQWLDLIAATVPDRQPTDRILAVPRSKDCMYREIHRIMEASGVAPKPLMEFVDGVPVLTPRKYQFKNFRSTAASVIEEHAQLGRLVTGHATDAERDAEARRCSRVFEENYLNSESRLVKALESMPLPATFRGLLSVHRPHAAG